LDWKDRWRHFLFKGIAALFGSVDVFSEGPQASEDVNSNFLLLPGFMVIIYPPQREPILEMVLGNKIPNTTQNGQ